MRLKLGAILLPLLLMTGPRAATAQEPRTLTVPTNAAWQHAGTGMILPPSVGGLARDSISDSSQNETDVDAAYIDRGEQMVALVYIYRAEAGDLPVWFDRAVALIILPQNGAAAPTIEGFTRPGASLASGLRAAMPDNVPGMRSTAMAIAPLGGGWLVKIRMGSARLDPAALNERLTAFAAALRWPTEAAGARAAAAIEPCPTPLRLREARIIRTDPSDVLMDSIVGSVEPEPGQQLGPPPVYCREPGATVARGVYRPDGSTESYLIAINDAGIAIGVGDASGLTQLVGNGRPRVSVTLYDRNSISTYPSFNRLPSPDQAYALVRDGHPLSTSTGPEITVSTDALEHR